MRLENEILSWDRHNICGGVTPVKEIPTVLITGSQTVMHIKQTIKANCTNSLPLEKTTCYHRND
jgi:hypothetical protein